MQIAVMRIIISGIRNMVIKAYDVVHSFSCIRAMSDICQDSVLKGKIYIALANAMWRPLVGMFWKSSRY